jgi:hypothetical protein
MKKCENCCNDHKGEYGSGRFCSMKCSRGFSTKERRKEINEKVSIKLKKIIEEKNCLICGRQIISRKKTCSEKCKKELISKVQIGVKKNGNYSKNGGVRPGGGKSKMIEYINHLGKKMKLNPEEIQIAKILDFLKIDWDRNTKGFPYESIKGERRNFYPDFYDNSTGSYIEYKGWVTKEMSHKMEDARKRNRMKLLIVYGNDKRYRDLGLNLSQIESNPQILKDQISLCSSTD